VAACAKLQLGVGIGGVVVDHLGERPLHEIGGAGDQHDEIGHPADRLVGVADLVIDIDGAGGGDQPDEEADAEEHLETEADDPHTLAPNTCQHSPQRYADHRADHHQCLVARVGEDQRDEAERIDRLGKAVVGVEAGIDRPCRDRGQTKARSQRDPEP
jgi:hypothetical protein